MYRKYFTTAMREASLAGVPSDSLGGVSKGPGAFVGESEGASEGVSDEGDSKPGTFVGVLPHFPDSNDAR